MGPRRLLRASQSFLRRRHELRRAHQFRLGFIPRRLGFQQRRGLIGRGGEFAAGVGENALRLRQLSHRGVSLPHGALQVSHALGGAICVGARGVSFGAQRASRQSRRFDRRLELGDSFGPTLRRSVGGW